VGEEVLASLRRAFVRALRGKRGKRAPARFAIDRAVELARLAEELEARRYTPSAGRAFAITDPKPRVIYALPFRDRVVQHLLIERMLPALERWFAPQSYACRVGKGTHRALRRAAELTCAKRFVLRVDIQKFFPSIDHAHLRALLEPFTPPELRWLRDAFLAQRVACEPVAWHFPGDTLFTPYERPHGLPIGSLTSQIWANAFLTPIDHLVASQLGLGTFVRYCDDLLVFDDDADRLRDALERIRDRAAALRLRLHPEKTRLHRTTDPVRFVGFVLSRTRHGARARGGDGDGVRVRLHGENTRRFRARMRELTNLYAAGAVEPHEVVQRIRAWLAHASHGDTRALCTRELGRLGFTRGGELRAPDEHIAT
jgi:retron-type reverse transcriptase